MALYRDARLLIDGELVEATGRARFDNLNPATEEVLGSVPNANAEDARRAIAAARRAFDETGWSPDEVDRTFCHQVGAGHRKLMLEALDLDPARDYATLEWLGNTGSAALPVTMAIGLENGFVQPDDQVAMLGIGSGINCLMLAAQWRKSLVCSRLEEAVPLLAERRHGG